MAFFSATSAPQIWFFALTLRAVPLARDLTSSSQVSAARLQVAHAGPQVLLALGGTGAEGGAGSAAGAAAGTAAGNGSRIGPYPGAWLPAWSAAGPQARRTRGERVAEPRSRRRRLIVRPRIYRPAPASPLSSLVPRLHRLALQSLAVCHGLKAFSVVRKFERETRFSIELLPSYWSVK